MQCLVLLDGHNNKKCNDGPSSRPLSRAQDRHVFVVLEHAILPQVYVVGAKKEQRGADIYGRIDSVLNPVYVEGVAAQIVYSGDSGEMVSCANR